MCACVCVCTHVLVFPGGCKEVFSRNLDWTFRNGKHFIRWLWFRDEGGDRERGQGFPGQAEPQNGGGRAQLLGWVHSIYDRAAARKLMGKDFGFLLWSNALFSLKSKSQALF